MVSVIKYLFLFTFLYSSCPQIIDSQILYEDDCGDCWLPYCYHFNLDTFEGDHSWYYDSNQANCEADGWLWVIPGDPGDPFFNNY